MGRREVGQRLWFTAALLAVVCGAWPLVAADDVQPLRRQALALNEVTGDDPVEGEIKILADQPATARKLLATAQDMAQQKNQPFNYNAAYILARTAEEVNAPEAGQFFYRLCMAKAKQLQSDHRLAFAYGGLVDLLYASKKYDQALAVCQEILELKPFAKSELTPDSLPDQGPISRLQKAIQKVRIQVLAKKGNYGEALKLANHLAQARPDDWKPLELKAEVLREAGQNADSAKIYEEIRAKIDKDKSLKPAEKKPLLDGCRYILSGIYADMNQIDKATEQLQALLAEEPNNPTYNNDLGYIWADHDKNLAEAEKMIRKAIEEDRKLRKKEAKLKPAEDKDNASYLDSLGWVLFKEKKYKEAQQYLLQATQDKDEGQHTEIFDHLGDIDMALGDKAGAAAAWKKAIELAGPAKREQERKAQIEKKLKNLE